LIKYYRGAKTLNATISAGFWNITQGRVVIPYWPFGKSYWSHF